MSPYFTLVRSTDVELRLDQDNRPVSFEDCDLCQESKEILAGIAEEWDSPNKKSGDTVPCRISPMAVIDETDKTNSW